MTKMFEDVLDFHRKMGLTIQDRPGIPGIEDINLRTSLIEEEYEEVMKALEADDLVEIADGLADLIYVCCGCAATYGINLDRVWDEVHRTNMAKERGTRRGDGKVLKPEGWRPPDIASVLAASSIEVQEN